MTGGTRVDQPARRGSNGASGSTASMRTTKRVTPQRRRCSATAATISSAVPISTNGVASRSATPSPVSAAIEAAAASMRAFAEAFDAGLDEADASSRR